MKIRILICYITFMLTHFAATARLGGQARVDSLTRELAIAKSDTDKVGLMNRIAYADRLINPGTGINYAKRALQLAAAVGWEKGKAGAYNSLSVIYEALGQSDTAIVMIDSALIINRQLGDKRAVAVCLGNKANIYQSLSDFRTALELSFETLRMREELNDRELIATLLMNIGNIYAALDEYNNATLYLRRALLYIRPNDDQDATTGFIGLGSVHQRMGNFDSALLFYRKAAAIAAHVGNKNTSQMVTGKIGNVYLDMKEYDKSLSYNQQAFDMSVELGDKEGQACALADMGKAHIILATDDDSVAATPPAIKDRGLLKKGISELAQAIMIAKEIQNVQMIYEYDADISQAYMLDGNYKAAMESFREYSTLRDSVMSNDNMVKIAHLETRREEDLKNKQIELTHLTELEKRNEQLLLLSGLATLLAAVVITRRAHDKQKKANEEKEVLLKQKDDLMKEVHHRVKNNLQVIGSLLDLQQEHVTDDTAKLAMVESASRVRSISLIHQHLYQHDNITAIELSSFAEDLLKQVTAVFMQPGQHIQINNYIPETNIDIDTGISLGLILNELITNSFKYVFSGEPGGTIDVSLQKTDEHYKLIYKDHGDPLDPETLLKSGGLGMRMVRSLSKQLGGTFSYHPVNGAFYITFKDEAGRKMID